MTPYNKMFLFILWMIGGLSTVLVIGLALKLLAGDIDCDAVPYYTLCKGASR